MNERINVGDIVKVSPDYIDEYSQIIWYEDINADTIGTVRDIEPNDKFALVRWNISENTCVDVDIQISNLILVKKFIPQEQFVPKFCCDNYGKYPHDGLVVPTDKKIGICYFSKSGVDIYINGCVSSDGYVYLTAEKGDGSGGATQFDEESFLDLADAFDAIVMRLYDADVDLDEVEWFADWCESQTFSTCEPGPGLLISNTEIEHGYPYGSGFRDCNKIPNFDSDFDFEDEVENEDSNSKDVIINIFM